MPGVLTLNSSVTCGHSGTVQTTSSTKLTVDGAKVLLLSGISGKGINGCLTVNSVDGNTIKDDPCGSVVAAIPGESSKLTAGGTPVAVDTLSGTTDGILNKTTPVTGLSGSADQTKLAAR